MFLCHKIMNYQCMKNKHIFGQDCSWIIDLNLNGAKPVTDNGILGQNSVAGIQVCRCHPCLGGWKFDCNPLRCQLHIHEPMKIRNTCID